MSVHIDELHSDVAFTPSSPEPRGVERPPEPPWVLEDRWRQARECAEWATRRVSAVGFDD